MIENYKEKKKNGTVSLEFAESGSIAVLERRFDELTGIPTLKPTRETSTSHIDDLIADANRQLDPIQQLIADLTDLRADVAKKETEREKLAKTKSK